VWKISTACFASEQVRLRAIRQQRGVPIGEVLVQGCCDNRAMLKERPFALGLKEQRCEFCARDETWRGRRMALILDHVNGVREDYRIENLPVLCPNCAGPTRHALRSDEQDRPDAALLPAMRN
jgi:hypothetical protein